AELLRLILAGDRTRLWASAHEALAWRGEYAGEIDWKPLAVELLEQTGDPAVDKLLISQIGAQWAAGKPSPLLAILARRNPAQMVELAARHLLRRSTCLGLDGEALDVVLASPPTALRVARELHERTDWWDRSPAFLIMCSLTGPEVEAELNAWVVAEVDHRIWDVVDQQKGVGFVKRRKAAAARPPSAESAPVPPTPPTATLHPPADHAVLWARVLACLEKRRAIPTGLATPGDIARHADAMLGHSEVSRFVFEYYYPAIYGETPVPDAARAWVEHFEKSA
ncbi:hypothetical protein HYW68_01250, partial [Candidatus Parcubacteria bacterium]|nr:hypothetical protein [Candidatus Parcubacteria bacterium]